MGKQALDKAFEYIDSLAAKLGVAAEHVYDLLVKQQIISGVMFIFISIILMVITIVISVTSFKTIKYAKFSEGEHSWDRKPLNFYAKYIRSGDEFLFPLVNLVGVASLVASSSLIYLGVKYLLNPEYYAIKEILKVIGG